MPYAMTPIEVRRLLEGYSFDEKTTLSKTGKTVTGEVEITEVDTEGLLELMLVSGTGIPSGAYIAKVNTSSIEISEAATADGTGVALTATTFMKISDDALVKARDYQVVPYVERICGISLSGTVRATEYHSGTGSSLLILNRRPIVQIHSINLITNPSNWVYVSPTSVDAISEEGILKLKTVLETWQPFVPAFPRGKDNIKVDYTYGFADVPDPVMRAVNLILASYALGLCGARTGGGSLTVERFSRNFGPRGKYTDIRNDLERWAYALLRPYMTGFIGG